MLTKTIFLILFFYTLQLSFNKASSQNLTTKDKGINNRNTTQISIVNINEAKSNPNFNKTLAHLGKMDQNFLRLKRGTIDGKKELDINTNRIKKIVRDEYTSYTFLINTKNENDTPIRNLVLENKGVENCALLLEYYPDSKWHNSYTSGYTGTYNGRISATILGCSSKSKKCQNVILVLDHVCNCLIYSIEDTCHCIKPLLRDLYQIAVIKKKSKKICLPKYSPRIIDSNTYEKNNGDATSLTSFVSPLGEPNFMKSILEINEILGVKVGGPAKIDIAPPPWLLTGFKDEHIYKIEDEMHIEEIIGEYDSFEQAYERLEEIAKIPWGKKVNKLPCNNWKKCERRYQIVEYDNTLQPRRKEVKRQSVLAVNSKGIKWIAKKASQ